MRAVLTGSLPQQRRNDGPSVEAHRLDEEGLVWPGGDTVTVWAVLTGSLPDIKILTHGVVWRCGRNMIPPAGKT